MTRGGRNRSQRSNHLLGSKGSTNKVSSGAGSNPCLSQGRVIPVQKFNVSVSKATLTQGDASSGSSEEDLVSKKNVVATLTSKKKSVVPGPPSRSNGYYDRSQINGYHGNKPSTSREIVAKRPPPPPPVKVKAREESNERVQNPQEQEDVPETQVAVHSDVPEGAIEVEVQDIESPSLFYVNIATNMDKLDDLMLDLNKAYAKNSEKPEYQFKVMPHVGDYVTCRYMDEWHRARVMKLYDRKKIRIMYVDYGTREYVPLTELRKLDKQFTKLEEQAIPVCLHGIKPKKFSNSSSEKAELCYSVNGSFSRNSSSKPQQEPSDVRKVFYFLIRESQGRTERATLHLVIRGQKFIDGDLMKSVDLYDKNTPLEDKSFAGMLIALGFAEKIQDK